MSESAAVSFTGRLRALRWSGSPNGAGWRGWPPPGRSRRRSGRPGPCGCAGPVRGMPGGYRGSANDPVRGVRRIRGADPGRVRREPARQGRRPPGPGRGRQLRADHRHAGQRDAWLAAVVTIPVTFAIFFSGVTGPNMAAGVVGALLAYVLPVATAAPASAIPSRLAGWWLACRGRRPSCCCPRARPATSSAPVRRPRPAPGRPPGPGRGGHLGPARGRGGGGQARPAQLFRLGAAAAYGLATADQGLANVTELLEWSAGLIADALTAHPTSARPPRPTVNCSVRRRCSWPPWPTCSTARPGPRPDPAGAGPPASAAGQPHLSGDPDQLRVLAARRGPRPGHRGRGPVGQPGHAHRHRARRPGPDRGRAPPLATPPERRPTGGLPALSSVAGFFARHASIRLVWFRNALRGSIALAVAVAVADPTGLQHGFWLSWAPCRCCGRTRRRPARPRCGR